MEDLLKKILSELQDVKTDVKSMKSDIGDLKADVATLKSDVSDLKTDVSTLKSDVSNIKTELAEFRAETKENFKIVYDSMDRIYNKVDSDIKELREGTSKQIKELHENFRAIDEIIGEHHRQIKVLKNRPV